MQIHILSEPSLNDSPQPIVPVMPVQAAIVGAGPYGLSLAAHLAHAGVSFRCFGQPMHSWATKMPAGMMLKSDGFASNLSAPVPFTLEAFCHLTKRRYHATQIPVALENFVAYGHEFARRLVPTLEPVDVVKVAPDGPSFRITLATGESFLARNVIIATGITPYPHIPEVLRHLPASVLTHTIDHASLKHFSQRDVTVIGRGSSALDAAALLQETGANVTLITRSPKVHLPAASVTAPQRPERSLYQRIRHPISPLGHSLRSWLSSNFPDVYFALPGPVRRTIVYKHLGPAGAAYLRGRVYGKVEMLRGWTVTAATFDSDTAQVDLTLTDAHGQIREHRTSHILAGTGFRIDLTRLSFLPAAVVDCIRRDKNGAPKLSRHFETSVPGLYIIGSPAAASFGPLLRFVSGVNFAATRVAQRLMHTNS